MVVIDDPLHGVGLLGVAASSMANQMRHAGWA